MPTKQSFTNPRHQHARLTKNTMDLPTNQPGKTIPGPAGALEIQLDHASDRRANDPIAVICHPHPLFGGTLSNKVVHIIARTFKGMGVTTLRFNFRGVGRSEGKYDEGRGEQHDLLAAVAWMGKHYPDAPLWLGGFSFGSAIALACWQCAGAKRLLLVSPPVAHDYFPQTPVEGIDWMVIMGSADEVVSPNAVSRWVSAQPHAPKYCYLEGASHFFHGRLIDLRETLQQAWTTGHE